MSVTRTDVLVIGTGFGAAAPALRLAQAGLRVLMLEKGPHINPFRDFRQTQDPKYILRYIKGLSGDHINFTFAEGLGGGSGFYEMVSLRAPSLVFQQRDEDGHLLWPSGVDRAALDPYYEIAERMLKVEQIGRAAWPMHRPTVRWTRPARSSIIPGCTCPTEPRFRLHSRSTRA